MSKRRLLAIGALWAAITLAAGVLGGSIVATLSPVAPNFAAGVGFGVGVTATVDLGLVLARRRRSDD